MACHGNDIAVIGLDVLFHLNRISTSMIRCVSYFYCSLAEKILAFFILLTTQDALLSRYR